MQTEDMIKEAKAKLAELRNEMEEFSMKASLGAQEAKDTFEREWGKFSNFIDEQGNRFRRQSAWAGKLSERMNLRLDRLKTLILNEKPDAPIQYNGWREEVVGTIYEVEFIIHELYPMLDDQERELFSNLRVKMEIYRTNLVIKDFDQLTQMGAMAEALAAKADEVKLWYDRFHETSSEKMEKFREGLRTSFGHLKNTFTELFK
ncbi:MAG: hypothetical protein JNJ57_18930 [Saprospiraceae bacterium]|nr:hypothetical protein [Saprospiraceae bacterium]